MNNADDTLLMSYVDGELDVATSREVEDLLRLQPHLAEQVRRMREDSALLRTAFNHVLHDAPRAMPRELLGVRGGPRSIRHGNWRIPLAMAASALLLACGVLLGHGLGSPISQEAASTGSVRAAVADNDERNAALQAVLEAHNSGSTLRWATTQAGSGGHTKAVSTYRNNEGRFCREFEETRKVGDSTVVEAGVACRDDNGKWRVRIRYYP